MNGLIIEGVAGTGKSTLLALLENSPTLQALKPHFIVVDEDRTTGELVSELRDATINDHQRCHRLRKLWPTIEEARSKNQFMILERFHPTYYALMPQWSLVEDFDTKFSELGFGLVLLDLPNEKITNRSFFRPEMENQNWQQGLIDWYGSQDNALKAFVESQENRRQFCRKTKLPVLRIDTEERNWQNYRDQIIEFITHQ